MIKPVCQNGRSFQSPPLKKALASSESSRTGDVTTWLPSQCSSLSASSPTSCPNDPKLFLFEQKELTHTILLHPSYFGPRMLQFLESKLYSDVEGTCSGQFGYIIAVVSVLDIGKGMVLSGSGQAEFITRYRAIVFKPFKGEVVDGVVNNVNKVCPRGLRFWMKLLMLFAGLDGFLCRSWPFNNLRVTPGGSH